MPTPDISNDLFVNGEDEKDENNLSSFRFKLPKRSQLGLQISPDTVCVSQNSNQTLRLP